MASFEDAHAVTTTEHGPKALNLIATFAAASLEIIMGTKSGCIALGSLFGNPPELGLQGFDPSDAVSQDHADPFRFRGAGGKARVRHRFHGGDHRELGEAVHPPGFLGFEGLLRHEVPDLPADLRGKVGGVETVKDADAVLSRTHRAPEIVDILSEGIHCPHAGHYHSSRHVHSLRPRITWKARRRRGSPAR